MNESKRLAQFATNEADMDNIKEYIQTQDIDENIKQLDNHNRQHVDESLVDESIKQLQQEQEERRHQQEQHEKQEQHDRQTSEHEIDVELAKLDATRRD